MSLFNNNLMMGAAGASGGGGAVFDPTIIPNSVWMDGSADGFTIAAGSMSAADGKEFTLGTWFQLTEFGVSGALFCADAGSNVYTSLRHSNDDKIYFQTEAGSQVVKTDNVFRDVGWYHMLLSVDTTQAVSTNRVKLFINGLENILTGTFPAQDFVYEFNLANIHEVGDSFENGAFEGYLAQSFMIGSKSIQQGDFDITDFLDSFTFGTNGSQFVPKSSTDILTLVDAGSSNSFLLKYENSGSLGLDSSTNTNNFTATSMTSANQSTNTSSKTFSMFNPLANGDQSSGDLGSFSLSDGNQTVTLSSSNQWLKTTVPFVMSGSKIIRTEFTIDTVGNGAVGITGSPHSAGTYHTSALGIPGQGEVLLLADGSLVIDGNFGGSGYTSSFSNGDVIDVIVNLDVGAVWFARNGTLGGGASQAEIQAGTTTNAAIVSSFVRRTAGEVFNFYAAQTNPSSTTITYNSGHSAFSNSYSSITSLVPLSTADLAAPDFQGIDFFDATLYKGNGNGQRVGDFVPFTDIGTISQSVAFNKADSDKLTIASSVSTTPTNVQKKTISCWLKPLEAKENWIYVGDGGSDSSERIYSNSTGQLQYITRGSGSQVAFVQTEGAFLNDPTQWVHVVFGLDYTTGSTEADRVKIWVNGVRITDLTSSGLAFPAANMTSEAFINKASTDQIIGKHPSDTGAAAFSNMYYAEYFMVDGHQLDASVFGQLDTSTNRWVPKASSTVTTAIGALSGGFGNCGFYLDFSNTSDYGEDDSGNNRDWTEGGVLDATNQFTDSPSLNFAVMNPYDQDSSTSTTLSEGNLKVSMGTAAGDGVRGTLSYNGKMYWEVELDSISTNSGSDIGIATKNHNLALSSNDASNTDAFLGVSSFDSNLKGFFAGAPVDTAYGGLGNNFGTAGKCLMFAVDIGAGKFWAGYDGTWFNSGNPAAGTNDSGIDLNAFDTWFPAISRIGSAGSGAFLFNFGQSSFTHTAPTGFSKLNQDNLDDTASKITAFAWIKNRDATDNHMLFDRIRGVGEVLNSNNASAEVTNENTVQRFLQRGVQVGNDVEVNTSNEDYVLWQWLLGDSASTGSTNEEGTINSTTLVADADYFSIVSYTGSGSNATVGHGLSAAPQMFIVRDRTDGNDWNVYGEDANSSPASGSLRLDSNAGFNPDSTLWNSTVPSSTVINLGSSAETNELNKAFIAYCFRSIPGVCKVGSYRGNGNNNGAYVPVGFLPRYILVKGLAASRNWNVLDTARNPTNIASPFVLLPNTNAVDTAGQVGAFDILSEGFKPRDTAANTNADGETYIYLAMADLGGNGTLPPTYGR